MRTSTRNLQSVAQKMAELLHNYVKITELANYKIYQNELKYLTYKFIPNASKL